jgi:hypothetical protein
MPAVWYRFRAELRTRWRAWLGLAVLVGVAGGVVVALAAGARRTETAYPRLLAAQRPYDTVVFERGFGGDVRTPPGFLDQVERVRHVVESDRFHTVYDNGGRTDDGTPIGEPYYLQTIIPADEPAAKTLARQKLLQGRHPDPAAADEVAINFTVADRYDLDVGDTFQLELFTEPQARAFFEEGRQVGGVMRTFRVVGVYAAAGDFPPRSLGDGAGSVNFSPAYAAAHPELMSSWQVLTVRLAGGEGDLPAFRAAAERAAGGASFDALGTFSITGQHAATERAVNLLTVALWLLTGLAGVAGTLILGQALARAATLESVDHATLQALGVTGRELALMAMARAAVIAAVGALVATGLAVALSPLFPLGLARTAEPDPGIRVDGMALALGAGAILVAVALLAGFAAWRSSRRTHGTTGTAETTAAWPSRVAGGLARAGFPPAAVAGARMALEPGRGRTAVPVRTTLLGAVVGVSALAGALTFAAGLDHLLGTPRLYGWNWDVTVGDGYGAADAYDDVAPALADDPTVEAWGAGTFGAVEVDGREVFALATDAEQGSIGPTVVAGRGPAAPDEILLGPQTLEALGLRNGDAASVRFVGTFEGEATNEAEPRSLTVVGEGVLPEQSDIGLDDAAAMTFEGLTELAPGEELPRNFFPVRFADGVDSADGLAGIDDDIDLYTVPVQRPTDLVNFGRVDTLPVVGAGLLALVAAAMLTHVLMSSIQRRRRDLALLKTLGFTTPQVSLTVACQATTIAAVALLVGLPLGVAAGRWAWTVAAGRLGVVVEAVVPLAPIVLAVPAIVIVANLIAAVPGWLAARTRPAVVLRAE